MYSVIEFITATTRNFPIKYYSKGFCTTITENNVMIKNMTFDNNIITKYNACVHSATSHYYYCAGLAYVYRQ